jgi:hypothetical protein
MRASILSRAGFVAGLLAVSVACAATRRRPWQNFPTSIPPVYWPTSHAWPSDEFQGRAPGGEGERLTVDYLTTQFKAAGLEPGNPDGTYVQNVPLVGTAPHGEFAVYAHAGRQVPHVACAR